MSDAAPPVDIAESAHSDQSLARTAASVDPAEQAFYRQLADTWWDRRGPFWPLHRLNTLRVRAITDSLCQRYGLDAAAPRPLASLRVLDIGCGGGILSAAMARLGADVHGIDVVERNIAVARHHALANDLDIRYEAVTAEALAEQDTRYDVVLCMEVVEHVADLPGFLAANCALLEDEGTLFVATINRTLRSWLFAIIGAEYVLGWLPRGTHQWRRFPTPAEIEALLERDGVRVSDRYGVAVNPFTRKFRLTGDLSVNYMLTASRPPVSGVARRR